MKRLQDTTPLPRIAPVVKFDQRYWRTIRPVERQMLRQVQRTRKASFTPLEDLLVLALAFVMALAVGIACLVALAALLGGAVSS